MISINILCFLKASLVVVPIPHKLVMGILVVTLEAHAATTTPVVISAPSAVMTLREDVCSIFYQSNEPR
jgi:hypothetical protein